MFWLNQIIINAFHKRLDSNELRNEAVDNFIISMRKTNKIQLAEIEKKIAKLEKKNQNLQKKLCLSPKNSRIQKKVIAIQQQLKTFEEEREECLDIKRELKKPSGYDLFLISIDNKNNIPVTLKDKAINTKTPILIQEKNKFFIYGDRIGNDIWDWTSITKSSDFMKLYSLPFNKEEVTLLKSTNPLFTSSLINTLKEGHTKPSLKTSVRDEVDRVAPMAIESIIFERVQRAAYTFWFVTFFTLIAAICYYYFSPTRNFYIFISPLVSASATWIGSIITIPVGFKRRIIGGMESALLKDAKKNKLEEEKKPEQALENSQSLIIHLLQRMDNIEKKLEKLIIHVIPEPPVVHLKYITVTPRSVPAIEINEEKKTSIDEHVINISPLKTLRMT